MTTTTRPSTVDDHLGEARRLLTLIRPTALTNEELLEFLSYDSKVENIVAAANAHTRIALVDAVLAATSKDAARIAAVGEAAIA